MDFSGKLILITGGSSGIGLATAKILAAKGANIWILSRDPEKLAKAEAEIRASRKSNDQKIGVMSADVSDEKQVSSILTSWMAESGTPDIVINSSGIVEPGYFEEQTEEIFHQMMDVDFFGTLHVIKTIVPAMIARHSGHIVNISSGAGFVGWFGYSAYGAAKYAVRGLSEQLRTELKPQGIRVSVVFPFDTKTPQLEYDDLHKPPETKALSTMIGSPVKAEFVAKYIVKGIERNRFYIVPGLDIQVLFFLYNSFPGIILPILDWLVERAVKKTNGNGRKQPAVNQ